MITSKNYILAPSVLGANFMNLKQEIQKCEDKRVNWIHYDVMDYHFVPNLTFGSKILKDIRNNSSVNIDIHFMVDIEGDCEDFFADFIKADPQMMTMHVESLKTKQNIINFINICKKNDIVASIAISPDTNIDEIKEYLNVVDNILVMSVNPGFGGQKFMPIATKKIEELDKLRTANKYNYSIEIDGGINAETVKQVKEAGVDMIVAGSYFFGASDTNGAIESLVGKDGK